MDKDSQQLQGIVRGIVQINLRLARILETVEASAPGSGAAFDDTLDVLLDLLDVITLATRSAPPPVRRRWWQVLAPRAPGPDPRLAGILMAREHALARLASAGIRPVDARGAYDAALHQAIDRIPTADPALHGTIADVHHPGWLRSHGDSEQVLRAARVTVFVPEDD